MSRVSINGPCNDAWSLRENLSGAPEWCQGNPFVTECNNLGDALRAYAEKFRCKITIYEGDAGANPWPDGGPRYFHCTDESGQSQLVDIHVNRGSAEICPKQDLDFSLQDGDIIEIGVLVC
jgi:hypothetical protein